MTSLEEVGKEIVERINDEFSKKGLNNTGQGRDSVTFKSFSNKLVIESLKRVLLLEFGRRPDPNYNSESWKKIYPAIEAWVRSKLNPPEEEVFITSKFIADKIQREGTRILKDRSKGLELNLLLDEYLDIINSLVVEKETEAIVNGLVKEWQ